jgi:hypothetical protein
MSEARRIPVSKEYYSKHNSKIGYRGLSKDSYSNKQITNTICIDES